MGLIRLTDDVWNLTFRRNSNEWLERDTTVVKISAAFDVDLVTEHDDGFGKDP